MIRWLGAACIGVMAAILGGAANLGVSISVASAHGSMENPISRVYECYLEGPETPKSDACRAAVALGGTQALYDWPAVSRQDAAGQSRSLIPDGHLCSANQPEYQGLDLARSDWPATVLPTSGDYTFTFKPTVLHRGGFELYVTRDGYDPTQPLKWSDLDPTPFATIADPNTYSVTAPIPPGKHGRHLIYTIWQRIDSAEAFYACSDVVFGSEPTPTPSSGCPDQWSPVVSYVQGVTVGFNGHAWQARYWTRGDQPGTGDPQFGAWQDLGLCGSAGPSPSAAPPPTPTPSPSCPAVMAAPGGVTGLAGSGQATFTWTSPPSDCSGPPTAYAIYLYGQDGSQQIQVAVAAAYAFSGVSPGVYYTATVTAWDGQRWSAWSQWAPWVLGG